MKKLVSCVLTLAVLLTFSLAAVAETVDFVPSITNKGAPEPLIIGYDDDGEPIIGYLLDEDGDIISAENPDCIIVTPVSDALTSDEVSEDIKDKLLEAYDELNAPDAKLSEIFPTLNQVVADEFGEDLDADYLVIRDLFDVTALCDPLQTHLPKADVTFDLTFDLGIADDAFITTMVRNNGVWTPVVKTVNNGDGTVTVTLEDVGQVAFLVDGGDNVGPGSPQTGDNSREGVLFWSAMMVASFAMIVVLAIYRRKRVNG